MSFTDFAAYHALAQHCDEIAGLHLRDLLTDADRSEQLIVEEDGIIADFSRQNITLDTRQKLMDLATESGLYDKLQAMMRGDKINGTENRAVLHTALRAPKGAEVLVDGENVIPEVHKVLKNIKKFSDAVRGGKVRGSTGKKLTQVVAIGIGGSYLGPEFVHEAFRSEKSCQKAADGRTLRFLANVDPIDASRVLDGLDAERTLVIVISKTFTTAETMLNAKTVRAWLVKALGKDAVAKHMVAVSTNLKAVEDFGINPKNAFGFWDWVGGRYSVCSAVGVLPLALQYGYKKVQQFLDGAHAIDKHVATARFENNIPVLLGLFGVWNSSFLGRKSRALLPYCQSLLKFAPHIQQVDMESNGKRVALDGRELDFDAGEVDFGEPGTNGQHSFYQLIHQGQVIPCDFIGFKKSQQSCKVKGHPVSNHDELMANFFAQPDALAYGKNAEELRAEGIEEEVIPHKIFSGNRPSTMLLFDALTPYSCGQLLSIYEHRTAVQGFIWGINSFDQMGVELGKVLAKNVVGQMAMNRKKGTDIFGFNPSTAKLLNSYLEK